MLNDERNAFRLLQALKELLKLKGIKYQQLAEKLGVSLPTIKRWLNSPNLSLVELTRICGVMNVSLADLLAFSEKSPESILRFTPKEELFLAKHPAYLAYYYEMKQGLSPTELESKHKLSRASSKKYLKKLEELNLVTSADVDSAKTREWASVQWDDFGPLGQVLSKEMLRQMSERMLSQFGRPTQAYLSLSGRSLSASDLDELKEDFRRLEEKYRKLSHYNLKIYPKGLLKYVSCAVMADEWDADVFSKVGNLP